MSTNKKEILWQSDLGDGTYKNPILFADYSDPDVIRVEDTYYMTASSFNYIPGLPILISKDLVNWKLVNYALDKIDYPGYEIPAHAKGVWAPAIRYHKEEFYIYYGMPDEGIFMVKTKTPLGKWEKPVLVLEGKGLIDPCPFWDEDGSAYVVHGYAKSRIGFKSIIGMFPMSPDGEEAIGEDEFIFNGVETQPTIEGPKIYKREGYYYIFAPAGGVRTGWQTVLRSKQIYGPYEERIVMKQGNSMCNGPHQGGLIDTREGEEWFIHFQDRGLYGRIVHLQPVIWKEQWPIIGRSQEGATWGEPCSIHKKPNIPGDFEMEYLQASDDFMESTLDVKWQWMGNSQEHFYSLSQQPGSLRLYALNPGKEHNNILWRCANVLTQKLVCPYFQAETCIQIQSVYNKEQAGMVIIGGQYAYLSVRTIRGEQCVVSVQSKEENGKKVEIPTVLSKIPKDQNQLWLRYSMMKKEEDTIFIMEYSLDGEIYVDTNSTFMPSDDTWVGAKIGLFAIALDQEEHSGYADFSYMKVDRVEKL